MKNLCYYSAIEIWRKTLLTTILQYIQILSGLLLILLVLIHSPKGDGIGAIGSASHLFSSQKGAEAGLNKITTGVVIVFMLTSLVLGLFLTGR